MFTYPSGLVDENLHVPVDIPVRLTLTSEDVSHEFYIPAFRLKMDAVPGRYNSLWFQSPEPREYPIYCMQYCGTGHSDMRALVIIHKTGEFEKWMENAANFAARMPPAEAGMRLYKVRGCAQCHSTDGVAGHGPTFKNIFGHDVALKGGATVKVDENYLRESIIDPQAKIVAGFEPVMPTYKGKLKGNEITALIEFIKTLKE